MSTDFPPTPIPTARRIRVFVSSTFRDMKGERDYLNKFVFPELRSLCKSRDVKWGEVDLRWGITDEETAEGQVLPLCLEEIERCHPFFICLLGDRYGSRPSVIPEDLVERLPWLKKYKDRSVTELEIIQGALLRPQEHAYFYFRNPGTVHAGDAPKGNEDDDSIKKLADLKDRIQNVYQVKSYASYEELGKQVLADFRTLIYRLFPAERDLLPWKREFRRHESYANRFTDYYLNRVEVDTAIVDFAKSDGASPLVIAAETGGGKTAILANWAAKFRSSHSNECILTHYVESSRSAANLAMFLDRIVQELRARLGLSIEFEDDEIHSNLPLGNAPSLAKAQLCLEVAAKRIRVVIIVDGIDRLDASKVYPNLTWLEHLQLPNVRWIVSTSPGQVLDLFRGHNASCINIPALREEPGHTEISTITSEYLWTFYSKKLSQERQSLISECPLAANPLNLVSVLEEVRLFGEHRQLDEQICLYTRSQTAEGLYDQILQRWEQDYEGLRPNLVRDALGFLWTSRNGLSESELLDLLGSHEESLPYAIWAPLARATNRWIVDESDRLKLVHNSLRDAVRIRYLESQTYLRSLRLKLADFFRVDPNAVPSLTVVFGNVDMYSAGGVLEHISRVIEEVPWQLSQAGEWAALAKWLATPAHISEWSSLSESDFRAYWIQIERNSTETMVKTYGGVISGEEDVPDSYRERIIALLRECGHANEALAIQERSAMTDDPNTAYAGQLGEEAVTLERLGRTKEAILKLEKQIDLYRHLGAERGLARAAGNLGAILVQHELRCSDAMSLLKEQEQICLRFGDDHGLEASLGNQALALLAAGKSQEARSLLSRQETLCRLIGNRQDLSSCLGNQALIELKEGQAKKALVLLRQQEDIVREVGFTNGLQFCLMLQSESHLALGDLRSAMALARQREELCKSNGILIGQIGALETQVEIYTQLNSTEEVLRVEDELIGLARRMEDEGLALAQFLRNKAETLMTAGKENLAITLLDEAREIYLRNKQSDLVAAVAKRKAHAYFGQGMLEDAIRVLDVDLITCRTRGDQTAETSLLSDKAVMLVEATEFKKAKPILKQVETRCRRENDQEGLAVALANLASVAFVLRKYKNFSRPAEEAIAIARRIGRDDIVAQLEPALKHVEILLSL